MSWLYMADCIGATIALMEAPSASISVRMAYNVQSVVFSPADLAHALQRKVPSFRLEYSGPDPTDNRQAIAESVPYSLDDSVFRRDTGWEPVYDLEGMVTHMLAQLRETRGRARDELPRGKL